MVGITRSKVISLFVPYNLSNMYIDLGQLFKYERASPKTSDTIPGALHHFFVMAVYVHSYVEYHLIVATGASLIRPRFRCPHWFASKRWQLGSSNSRKPHGFHLTRKKDLGSLGLSQIKSQVQGEPKKFGLRSVVELQFWWPCLYGMGNSRGSGRCLLLKDPQDPFAFEKKRRKRRKRAKFPWWVSSLETFIKNFELTQLFKSQVRVPLQNSRHLARHLPASGSVFLRIKTINIYIYIYIDIFSYIWYSTYIMWYVWIYIIYIYIYIYMYYILLYIIIYIYMYIYISGAHVNSL